MSMNAAQQAAAMRVIAEARIAIRTQRFPDLHDALFAFDAIPAAEGEERTEAQEMADDFAYDIGRRASGANADKVPALVVPTLLVALRDDLRALAAAVKERR